VTELKRVTELKGIATLRMVTALRDGIERVGTTAQQGLQRKSNHDSF
jgi:hypothetical protein